MMEGRSFIFFKFGSEENITDLFENGTIYFNTIDYFQKLEGQGLRGDNYEGTTKIINHKSDKLRLTITIPETGKEIPINLSKFHLREFLKDIIGNLYSLYCLGHQDVLESDNFKIDPRVKEFGTHFIIIQKPEIFINLICNELDKNKFDYQIKQVEYYEKEKINGEISLFHKTTEFEYQKEFRIVLFNNENKPKKIQIGSLKDYAEVFKVDVIDTMKIVRTEK
jgi:hypothetical protein